MSIFIVFYVKLKLHYEFVSFDTTLYLVEVINLFRSLRV